MVVCYTALLQQWITDTVLNSSNSYLFFPLAPPYSGWASNKHQRVIMYPVPPTRGKTSGGSSKVFPFLENLLKILLLQGYPGWEGLGLALGILFALEEISES